MTFDRRKFHWTGIKVLFLFSVCLGVPGLIAAFAEDVLSFFWSIFGR